MNEPEMMDAYRQLLG